MAARAPGVVAVVKAPPEAVVRAKVVATRPVMGVVRALVEVAGAVAAVGKGQVVATAPLAAVARVRVQVMAAVVKAWALAVAGAAVVRVQVMVAAAAVMVVVRD